jgi:hypothetical protein
MATFGAIEIPMMIGAAVTLAATAASTTMSVMAASQQNQAIAASMKAQQEATRAQQQQLADQVGMEKEKVRRQTGQIIGRMRVAGGESGLGFGGSMQALQQQANMDMGMNLQAMDQNYWNQIGAVQSGHRANMAQMQGQVQNPLIAGFTGGLTGMSTGLQIGGGIESFGRMVSTPKPVAPKPYTAGRLE